MIDGKEGETSGQQIASHGPCVKQMTVIYLQTAHHDDEHAIGEYHSQLGEKYLWASIDTLERWSQHAFVVHACRQFVPRAEQAGDHQCSQ